MTNLPKSASPSDLQTLKREFADVYYEGAEFDDIWRFIEKKIYEFAVAPKLGSPEPQQVGRFVSPEVTVEHSKSASPSEPRALIRKAAEELVAANADHGRTYDNSPDVDETARIISKWLIGAEPRRDDRERFEAWMRENWPKVSLVHCPDSDLYVEFKADNFYDVWQASRASAALPQPELCPSCGSYAQCVYPIINGFGCGHSWHDRKPVDAVPQPSAGQTEGK